MKMRKMKGGLLFNKSNKISPNPLSNNSPPQSTNNGSQSTTNSSKSVLSKIYNTVPKVYSKDQIINIIMKMFTTVTILSLSVFVLVVFIKYIISVNNVNYIDPTYIEPNLTNVKKIINNSNIFYPKYSIPPLQNIQNMNYDLNLTDWGTK